MRIEYEKRGRKWGFVVKGYGWCLPNLHYTDFVLRSVHEWTTKGGVMAYVRTADTLVIETRKGEMDEIENPLKEDRS